MNDSFKIVNRTQIHKSPRPDVTESGAPPPDGFDSPQRPQQAKATGEEAGSELRAGEVVQNERELSDGRNVISKDIVSVAWTIAGFLQLMAGHYDAFVLTKLFEATQRLGPRAGYYARVTKESLRPHFLKDKQRKK